MTNVLGVHFLSGHSVYYYLCLCCICLLINILYEILCLIVATHKYTTQFERRPSLILSYVINPGLINTVG